MSRKRRGAMGAATFAFATGFFLSACYHSAEAPQPKGPRPYTLKLPLGLVSDSLVIPKDNPLTVEKLELGRRLYFDKALSLDRSISCASCHIPEKGFADPSRFSSGVGGLRGTRQSPTLVNRGFSARQFWDGRAGSLEEQAVGPVQNPVEMAMPSMNVVVERLRCDPGYVAQFEAAFPGEGITGTNVGKALAAFERTILSGNSPYDRFMAGDKSAMSAAAQRGWKLFNDDGKGNCTTCHATSNFSDENYNNIGVGMDGKKPDMGRYAVTGLEGHQGAFKTPTLREVARTAPYMHDGSQKTLEEVIDFYVRGGHPNKWLSPKIKRLQLTEGEKKDLIAFLQALSGEVTWYGK